MMMSLTLPPSRRRTDGLLLFGRRPLQSNAPLAFSAARYCSAESVSGFALLCRQPGLRAEPGALTDALKWAAARRRLNYNGRIVSAAGTAAWALWRGRRPEPG